MRDQDLLGIHDFERQNSKNPSETMELYDPKGNLFPEGTEKRR